MDFCNCINNESRQTDTQHNITAGGDKVAWLNAGRGRVLGPNASREVRHGETVNLSVHGKYVNLKKRRKANKASLLTAGSRARIMTDLGEFSRSGAGNPVTVLQLVDLIAQDLQTKKSPEAYLYYALYDSDSNLYDTGKKVLTKKAENRHEELTESLYISKSGYMETFVANETSEDVWFDNFRIQVEPPLVVQETHYDPWGLELTGLGYIYSGLHANRELYNGKEYIEENGLNYYDYGARMYSLSRISGIRP